MTDSSYEAQLRRQVYEARQEAVGLRADRARLEEEVGPLRQRLAEALVRAEKAEAKAAALEAELVPLHGVGQAGCDHRDPKQLGARPSDLALVCACGAVVFPSPVASRP
jgi:hypothetical protein